MNIIRQLRELAKDDLRVRSSQPLITSEAFYAQMVRVMAQTRANLPASSGEPSTPIVVKKD